MAEKCEHKTTAVLADEGNVTIEVCTWGCGAMLVTVTDGNGISHAFTADELLGLRERVAAAENDAAILKWIIYNGHLPFDVYAMGERYVSEATTARGQ